MPVCAVSTCRNTSASVGNTDIIFHPFPREDKRSLEWFMKCRRRDKKRANSTDRMCSVHFEEWAYERDIGHELLGKPPNRKLKQVATPTLNLPYIFIKPSEARKVLTPTLARQLNKRSSSSASTFKKPIVRRSVSMDESGQREGNPNEEFKRNISLPNPQLPTVNEEESESVRLVSKNHCEDLLSEIFNDESLMDLTISVDQKRIRAHRVVLQQASGYFRRNLINEEASTSSEYLLRINNISYEDMNRLMAFIYHGEVSVKASDLDRFLKATEFLDVRDLKKPATTANTCKQNGVTFSTNEPSSKTSNETPKKPSSPSQNSKKKKKSESSFKKRLKKNSLLKNELSKKKVAKVFLAELQQGIVSTLFLLY